MKIVYLGTLEGFIKKDNKKEMKGDHSIFDGPITGLANPSIFSQHFNI